MEGAKVTAGLQKSKKKQVKDEFDRIKQAEKKKRRLEKALANSAAIRSELETKKQRKKEAEEQERLEEEGAAIAEAVALHVLIDEGSSETMLNKENGLSSRDCSGSIIPHPNWSNYSHRNIGLRGCDSYRLGHPWNHWGPSNSMTLANGHAISYLHPRFLGHECWDSIGLSADHIAARSISSLSIADAAARRDAYMINSVLRG